MDIDTPRPETNKDEEEIIEEENPEANASNDEELDALFPNETIDPAAIMLEQQDLAEPNPTPKELAPAPKEPSKPKTAPVVSAVPAAPKSPKKPALKEPEAYVEAPKPGEKSINPDEFTFYRVSGYCHTYDGTPKTFKNDDNPLQVKHLWPATHKPSKTRYLLVKLMDGTFVIPLDQIFHVLFTATKRKGDTDEVDERRPLNKMPAGNVIEATTKAGENVKICYWPDHFVKFKENQSKMRANRKKKNEEAKKNEDPADKSGSDDESDQDEEDDSSSSEEEPKKKKKKEEESSSSEEEEKKKDDDSSSSEEEKPAKKPASKPAVPAKKPAKDEESSEEKPAKKPVPAAFAKKPTPAPVKKPTKDEDSSSEEEKKPAPKKPASKPATPAKKPAKDEESSEEKPKKAAPSPAPKKGEKRPLETTTDTATQAANKKPRVDPKPAAPEATPAVKEEANFKQYGSALTPNNVRPRVLNVFKSDLVLASDAKIDLTLSEWIIVWAARAAKHTQPSIFLNQLTNIKLNPAYNLPVDADTALYQLLASPEKWEAFRQLMDVFKHKQLAHLSDLIQKLVPALAAQYEDVTPPVAAPAPVEKKKGSAVASVLAQKAKK